MKKTKLDLRTLIVMSVFAAISIVLVYLIRFPVFPAVSYLTYDPADITIFLCAMLISPVLSLILTFVVALIQAAIFEPGSFPFGPVMHLIATGAAAFVCGFIYRRVKNIKGAIIGLAAAVVSATAIMIPLNLLITPLQYTVPVSVVIELLPYIIAFNLVKFGINAAVTGLLFKPTELALRKTGATA
ncbi:MAG: ECF transporter S component [Clostridia bacterium]|nr:ECF transporter S component [Clostridia bacterium]